MGSHCSGKSIFNRFKTCCVKNEFSPNAKIPLAVQRNELWFGALSKSMNSEVAPAAGRSIFVQKSDILRRKNIYVYAVKTKKTRLYRFGSNWSGAMGDLPYLRLNFTYLLLFIFLAFCASHRRSLKLKL